MFKTNSFVCFLFLICLANLEVCLQPVTIENCTSSSSRRIWQPWGCPVYFMMSRHILYACCSISAHVSMSLCVCISARPWVLCGGHASFMALPLTDWDNMRDHSRNSRRPTPLCSASRPPSNRYHCSLQSHYPAESASLLALNNPYSYSIFGWMGASGQSS